MTSKQWITSGLVMLPLGLIGLGVFSFVFFFENSNAEIKEENTVSDLFQKDIDAKDLRDSVNMLAGRIGARHAGSRYEKLQIAATWIESTLGPSNMGYTVERQIYKAGGEEFRNLVVEIPGKDRRDEIVVVGAHYDTVPGCPGANDNATGVAALLSLANAFVGSENTLTLRFVAFVNEEPPFFQTDDMGSVVYARRCRERGEKIVAMISLETLGCYSDAPGSQQAPPSVREKFPDVGNFVALVAEPKYAELARACGAAFRRASDFPVEEVVLPQSVPGIGFSDHWSFWQESYPAVMVTDTAPYRYAHYHKPTDTPDKIDFVRLFDVVSGMAGVIGTLANPPAS